MDEYANDMEAVNKLFQVSVSLMKLTEELDGTALLAGREASAASFAFYFSLMLTINAGETGLKMLMTTCRNVFRGNFKKP